MKILVSNNDTIVGDMFKGAGYDITYNEDDVFDMLCLTGGMDIMPFLYGQRAISGVTTNFMRDLKEISVWKRLPPKFPKIGICRGAQLGNVLCGGKLYQNVDGHEGYGVHDVALYWGDEGRVVELNTLHHQMCVLTEEAKLLAVADETKFRQDEFTEVLRTDIMPWSDVEAFYYSNFNFFGVQWHPEYEHEESREVFFEMFRDLYPHNKEEYVSFAV